MTIRISVNGAFGKMGKISIDALAKNNHFDVVGQLDRQDNLADHILSKQPDVVLDFTESKAAYENTATIINCGAHPVIGTSGFLKDDIPSLAALCAEKKLGGIIAPNFSIAALLLMQQACKISEYYPNVEIIEMHHTEKKDAPSGTAIKTAEMIAAHAKINNKHQSQAIIDGALGAHYHNIPIHAVRLPGVIANQTIYFGGTGETLSLTHQTLSRKAFVPGILMACEKVMGLKQLIFGLEKLL